ncbi:Signal transduction histidine kinase [Sinosporangium album]|uniref:histidine kinase n=1 Tax=Sinosporangium album TaxID=504805 RepID=A0A1G8GAH0_9ACTN|nr:histidine kinase [Sinosporangium album]SDH91280.1 Signal transduction histidine kinase [Sinosporangium album]
MRNGAILAAIAVGVLVNGLHLDHIPLWRQFLFGALAVAGYLHGRHLPVRRDWPLMGGFLAAGLLSMAVDVENGVGAVLALIMFVTLPWLAGRFRRQQAELVETARERLVRMAREQELIAERVRLQERARIAADMHDSLGHELALIALRAGALELAADMDEHNREAASALRASAVTATDRLRRTLAVLRPTDVAAPVEPANETLDALVERARDAGMSIAYRCDGEDHPLPPLVDRAVHRMVQEALTNAARHATGAEVEVRVGRTGEAVTVTVSNAVAEWPEPPEDGIGGARASVGGGNGLSGLQERVRLLGGTFRAGADDGRFTVTASLPRGEV